MPSSPACRDAQVQKGRMRDLDGIIQGRMTSSFFSLEGISTDEMKKEMRVEELMVHVNARIERTEKCVAPSS